MKCTIEIEMDNAAFSPDAAIELGRILRFLAMRIEYDGAEVGVVAKAADSNGNTVGKLTISD